MEHKWVLILVWIALAAPTVAQDRPFPKFFPDDPIWKDSDSHATPGQPTSLELSDYYDLFSHSFSDLGSERRGEALNVNTLDEVPDSTWFTNRHGLRRMSIPELVNGPRSEGPPVEGIWTIFRSKSEGITPGFSIEDESGRRFVIKLEQKEIHELATAAEVISTQIFHALGYWVPENYIVEFDPANFRIREGTVLSDSFGDESPLSEKKLRKMLRPIQRNREGKIRVLASRYIPGTPIGPFRYYGTRSDDPNDVIAHEDRRELRALRLFAAWTNHDDTRAQNTQNTWVEASGKKFIRHYLIDFGSTLGSGSVQQQLPFLGFHYLMDFQEIRRAAIRFGAAVPDYRKVDWPAETKLQGVGLFESEAFDPTTWKPNYPNPAFLRMTDRDAFWAAKILMRFTPEELKAIIETGDYSNPESASYILKTLIERQRKIGREYLNRLNPLDNFGITQQELGFSNLAESYGLAKAGATYLVSWLVYDNRLGSFRNLHLSEESSDTVFEVPISAADLTTDEFLVAEIKTLHPRYPSWSRKVLVYFRPKGRNGFSPVGIERTADPGSPSE